jgi:tRNA U34 5-methylaminomethyl-2-thiouridine-forming methyltransferase MnmC
MERSILLTNDGSCTVLVSATGDTYHSRHGAIQESRHVYIDAGLDYYVQQHPGASIIRVFETGFGTGLNALLTGLYAVQHNINISYHTVEPFPLIQEEFSRLNYGELVQDKGMLSAIHHSDWGKAVNINPHLQLTKHLLTLNAYHSQETFDVIYHDAFAPDVQPELWTEEVFKQLYKITSPGGVLVTYSSKVVIRRAMEQAGYVVEKIPGPHGKRDMAKATRPIENRL